MARIVVVIVNITCLLDSIAKVDYTKLHEAKVLPVDRDREAQAFECASLSSSRLLKPLRYSNVLSEPPPIKIPMSPRRPSAISPSTQGTRVVFILCPPAQNSCTLSGPQPRCCIDLCSSSESTSWPDGGRRQKAARSGEGRRHHSAIFPTSLSSNHNSFLICKEASTIPPYRHAKASGDPRSWRRQQRGQPYQRRRVL